MRNEPGERVAYVTDTLFGEHTKPRMLELARGADIFACEAPFLAEHGDKAQASRHLTARQAGELAGEAGAKTLLPLPGRVHAARGRGRRGGRRGGGGADGPRSLSPARPQLPTRIEIDADDRAPGVDGMSSALGPKARQVTWIV